MVRDLASDAERQPKTVPAPASPGSAPDPNESTPASINSVHPRLSSRLAGEVYRSLLGMLISCAVPPGGRIAIDALSRELQVSQTPVREALSFLESDGLVVRTHNSGYRASPALTPKEVEDLFDVRLQLEPFLAGLAAERRSPGQVDEMCALAKKMTAGARELPQAGYAAHVLRDVQLHEMIAGASQNGYAQAILSRLHSHLHLLRLYYGKRHSVEALAEHDVIVIAIGQGNSADAQKAMQLHLEKARSRVLLVFQ